jgi:phytoene synthase
VLHHDGGGELVELVRRIDPDRFLCALFAPAAARDLLFVIAAFDHELARARAAVSEPGLALIRLHWWREVVQGARRRHEVAGPLGAALDQGRLDPELLLEMIDAREAEAEDAPFATTAQWRAYLFATAGAANFAAGLALGASAGQGAALRALGAGFGAGRLLRAARGLARQGRCLLPADALAAAGLDAHALRARPEDAGLDLVVRALAAEALGWMQDPAGLPRAASLPLVLARVDLRAPTSPPAPRGLGVRLAVSWAGLAGVRRGA